MPVSGTAIGDAHGSDPMQRQRLVSAEAERAAPTGVVSGPASGVEPPGAGQGQWREVGKKVEEHEKTISVLQEEIHK